MTSPLAFIISGNPASKSNSRRIVEVVGKLRSIKSAKALSYVAAAKRQVPTRADLPFRVPVSVTLRMFYADERSDMDETALLDALQSAYTGNGKERRMCWPGVWENDRLVRERHVYHAIDAERPRVEIEVRER